MRRLFAAAVTRQAVSLLHNQKARHLKCIGLLLDSVPLEIADYHVHLLYRLFLNLSSATIAFKDRHVLQEIEKYMAAQIIDAIVSAVCSDNYLQCFSEKIFENEFSRFLIAPGDILRVQLAEFLRRKCRDIIEAIRTKAHNRSPQKGQMDKITNLLNNNIVMDLSEYQQFIKNEESGGVTRQIAQERHTFQQEINWYKRIHLLISNSDSWESSSLAKAEVTRLLQVSASVQDRVTR
jgi:hypothetical protein